MKGLYELGGFFVLTWPLSFWILYLIGAFTAVIVASLMGRRYGRRYWGRGTAILLFLYMFWDLVPALGSYWYRCEHYAGFNQHKTLDEWKQENPGVARTLKPIKEPKWEIEGDLTRVPLNQRFVWEIRKRPRGFWITEDNERIVDVVTGEVLAEYVDFDSAGALKEPVNWASPRRLKFWLNFGSCESSQLPLHIRFNGYQQAVESLGAWRHEN